VSALTVGRATDSPYEPPLDPELRVDTTQMSAEEAAELIVETLLGQV
jgi:bifunctional enzyme CysN/CysC